MSSNFWEELKKPFFVLAPMADVTDIAFRQVVIECGRPDVLYTEFVSAAGLCSEKGRPKLLPHFKFAENEHPIVAQIFGSVPKHFYETAKLIAGLGFDGIDINMGCPDRKVVKQGAGIALCKTPELAAEIIAETKRGAGGLPIAIKTRLGFDKIDLTWIENILKCDIDALTIHLRTMKETSKVLAHWELAGEIAKLAHTYNTIIIGNGDVLTHAEGIQKCEQPGLDGIMIGRGIFSNPWFFNPSVDIHTKTSKERITLLKHHISNFMNLWDPPTGDSATLRNYDTMKRFFKVYIHGFDGAKELRDKLMQTKTPTETLALLK
ncbi:MAG: hypothetical protein A3I39_01305 [Candidatus Yanofskybacteria bacterium RIFCSPLOWO2_02_FULL_47_9b]|uniref:tRNA-dihydrouridine synthase n=1 Tax=Candidatus Yanofskybacteria bacterium RIFCSPLOWO2_02_FULL_47_9b TaxID=1802708 RepID=A0A1F8HBC0_9BACT|nr:MAG: hypothetical protein A3I39_01305 [Candidatus Yanofskybacteria bacterium RIFCSPLOWO2_02_FULL_47_9b]